MTTQLILENADKLDGIDIARLTGVQHPNYGRNAHPSFFLWRELAYSQAAAKKHGVYRHCKPYKGHFLDYIVRKEYATLEDWVADCGSDMNQIRFGYQKFDAANSHVAIQQLEDFLTPLPELVPIKNEMDEVTSFMEKLHVDELSLRSLLVRTRTSGIQTYREYMEYE